MKNKGFTLIELLVVVLIIGILAAIAVPQYQKSVYKSKSAQAVSMLRAIMQAQQEYYLVNNEYTDDFSKLSVNVPEHLLLSNAPQTADDTYYFTCAGKSYCSAANYNPNMPGFEFSNDENNKKYCISYGKNEIARDICKSMGPSDTNAWKPEDYYFIN